MLRRLIGMCSLVFTMARFGAEIVPVKIETLLGGGGLARALLGEFPQAMMFVATVTAGAVAAGWLVGQAPILWEMCVWRLSTLANYRRAASSSPEGRSA